MIEASSVPLMAVPEVDEHVLFADFMALNKDSLVNYLTRMCGSREHAEELAQEAFVRIYQHRHRYISRTTLTPLLFRVATNLLRSEFRVARRREILTKIFRRQTHRTGASRTGTCCRMRRSGWSRPQFRAFRSTTGRP